MLKHLISRWLLIALAVVLAVGYTQAAALETLADARWLRQGIVATVMFLMALPLGVKAMLGTVRNPMPVLLAVAMNAIAVPLAAWSLSGPLALLSEDMSAGLLVAGATPCTLASAAVWTRRAGGNDAVALMVTIITNLFCFLIAPFWLLTTTGKQIDVPFLEMATRLALLVVAPMAVAQLLRLHQPFGEWATGNKIPLGVAAQIGILAMVFLGAIGAGLRLDGDLSQLIGLDMLAMVAAVMAVHLGVLFAGLVLARLLRQRREDQIAIGIAGSQKTLMIGLHMATTYFPGTLAMLPMIVYHAGQLLADTVVADRIRESDKKNAK